MNSSTLARILPKARQGWQPLAQLAVAGLCLSFLTSKRDSLFAQGILLSDFEGTNYAWLPGRLWTAAGNFFGSGPAQGTLPDQQTVDGYLGNGLVNTYPSGNGSTGTLAWMFLKTPMMRRSLVRIMMPERCSWIAAIQGT
jgi:hypothetical protein